MIDLSPTPVVSDQVGLHCHTERSFIDGEAKIEGLVMRAKAIGQGAVAITDHEECNGHIEHQRQCQKHGIKPIFGMEGYFYRGKGSQAKADGAKPPDYSHITVLAQNQEGLRNLWTWSSQAYIDNFHYRAVQDWEGMKALSSGLYASDGCLLSYMAKAIIDDDDPAQHELMGRYLDTFDDRFFMELHTFQFMNPSTDKEHQLNEQMGRVNRRKVELAEQYSVPLVVVNDNHYASPEDWVFHNLVWAMKAGKDTGDQTEGEGRTAAWLMEDAELIHWMGQHGVDEKVVRQAIRNSKTIADDCNVEIVPELRMPRLRESPLEDIRLFMDLLEDGFQRKVVDKGKNQELYRARMEREARMIVKKDYAGYFNVEADLIAWAKHKAEPKMFIGPGRGSAGGSLVAYLMDITEMDPLKYDLLFERFISEDRTDFPDIDTDFPQSRLAEVKGYLASTYGADKVCQMGTLTRSAPKSILKDVARGLGVPIPVSNDIARAVGKVKPGATFEKVMDDRRDKLAPFVRDWPELFEKAEKMVGRVRNPGVHASGFVISDLPLMGRIPMRKKGADKPISAAFEYPEVEWLGFIKFDLLGLRHCDTIGLTLRMIEERHGVVLNPYEFDDEQFTDPAIWESVGRGDCLGLFQLDAELMTQTAKRQKPLSERDVAELVAVNRPGVIDAGLVTPYIERRHGREAVEYDHPMMEEFVSETYGILIYQEQIMKMVQKIAEFTPNEAEKLRKIVGKKQVERLPALRQQFFDGCHGNAEFMATCGRRNPEQVIEKIWSSIEASGSYLFNKSHSVGYGLIASWETWLRHYYYPEFITASLITVDDDERPRYVRHAEKRGLSILPPSINESGEHFTLTEDGIRYGLTSVKNVAGVAYQEIQRTRPYANLDDMLERVAKRSVNKTVVHNLIHIGAFDVLDPDRTGLQARYNEFMKIKEKEWKPFPDYSDELLMYRMEKRLVGGAIIYDPLRPYIDMIEDLCQTDPEEVDMIEYGETVKIGGVIDSVTPKTIGKGPNKGAPMAFLSLTYRGKEFRVVAFTEVYLAHKMFIEEDRPVIIRAVTNARGLQMTALQRLDFL